MRTLVPLLVVAVLVAACGGGEVTTREAQTAVVITLWPKGEGKGARKTARLVCDPQSGNLPDVATACAALASDAGRAALDPPPLDQLCTELYGGPAEARIMGTVGGETVDAHLSRVNGCEIQRWQALAALLPAYQHV